MTFQEIFNAAYLGLEAQGFKPALTSLGACAYRAEDGKRCAIGWLLKNPSNLEDISVKNEDVWVKVAQELGLDSDDQDARNFITKLQYAHDFEPQFPDKMKERMEQLAKFYHLTVPKTVAEIVEPAYA